jgi:hypothetical protein
VNHACGIANVGVGTVLPSVSQDPGDCKVKQCDGNGGVTTANDDLDVPNDSNQCTDDVCTGGVPSNPDKIINTACGTGLKCDGAGHCVGCVQPSDCGTDTECKTWTCTTGTCGFDPATQGKVVTGQTAGDCKKNQCDGAGNIEVVVDDGDLPVDANDCTDNVCSNGTPSNPSTTPGTTCSTGVCNGTGTCVQCLNATTCPGTDTECQTRKCSGNICGFDYAGSGTPVAAQTAGDCKVKQCNGGGSVVDAVDDTDKPDDSNACTDDVCTNGVPSNPNKLEGTSCGGAKICDANGNCVGCVVVGDCAGTDTECHHRICDVGGVCKVINEDLGTRLSSQTLNDCKADVCDGNGGETTEVDDTDKPVDGLQCTSDVCTSGVPTNPPVTSGTACTESGGTMCNATGQCVECLALTDCTGSENDCQTRTCISGSCGMSYLDAGTITATQVTGDCKVNKCGTLGSIVPENDDGDLPVDGKECTDDVCTAGVPSNPNKASTELCTEGSGTHCDGNGNCVTP